ncbi:MAG: hypothetical protein L0271_10275 [Gemmatimonadetes bacterium]|nr:hypothetical protein [Gemmatimonadota bacterium]
MIRLRMLGGLDLRGPDGNEVRSVLAQPKRLALFAYLAVTASRGFQRRDRILALFWPEQDREHARAALNRALYFLRRSLGEGVLVSRADEEVGLSTERFWSDVSAIELAVGEGRDRDALELYRGDLLEGLFVSDAPEFEQWLESERARIRTLACDSARRLAGAEELAGNAPLAAHWARWALDRCPYDEAALQELIALLDRTGDRAAAVHEYEVFARRISAELDLSPSPETSALIEQIRRRSEVANGVGSSGPADSRHTPEVLRAGLRAGTTAEPPAAAPMTGDPPAPARGAPVISATSRADSPVRGGTDPGQRPARRPWLDGKWGTVVRVSTLVVVALAAGTFVLMATRPPTLNPHRVAVPFFENRTGDASVDALGMMASDIIRRGLQQTGSVEVVMPSPTTHAGGAGGDLPTLAREARTAILIAGAVYRVDGLLRFEAQVVDGSRAQVVWIIPAVTIPAESAQHALEGIGERAAGAVAALTNPRFASWFPLATAPPTYEAFQAFARGTELQLSGQPREALTHYEQAIESDPTFTWAVMQSAVAHGNLGNSMRADSIADYMSQHRDRLSPLQGHWLDWMLAVRREDWLASYLAIERAAQLAPDRFLYMQAEVARWLNRPRKTVELLERLGPDGPFDSGLADYWYNLAEAYHQLGDRSRERTAARLARSREPDRAHALGPHIRLAAALGSTRELNAWLDTLLSLPRENRIDAGPKMMLAVRELRAHGHRDAAVPMLERAIDWYRSIPPEPVGAVDPRFELATALALAGQLDEAESIARAFPAPTAEELVRNQGFLGTIAARRGDRVQAETFIAMLEDSRQLLTRPGGGTLWQARIRALLGDAESAVKLLKESLGPQGQDLHAIADFEPIASHPRFRDFIRPKG